MRYFVKIDLDNDAFVEDTGAEVARILRELANRIVDTSFDKMRASFPVRDINGNQVGHHGYYQESKQ